MNQELKDYLSLEIMIKANYYHIVSKTGNIDELRSIDLDVKRLIEDISKSEHEQFLVMYEMYKRAMLEGEGL